MLYAIFGVDAPDSLEGRKKVRAAHLSRVSALRDEGRLILAGPHPAIDTAEPGNLGYTGSLIIAEFPSLEEAGTWADADPYVLAHVWHKVTVKPFVQVMP